MKRLARIALMIVGVIAVALVVGYLALLRADIPYARLEAKYVSPASRFMDLPGGLHIHYRDQGKPNGPPVVMVHGFSASLHAWEPWVARLGRDYRVVTLDLPGHGLTRAPAGYAASIDGYADIVDAAAQRLKLGPYVVVGNSMGGACAWDDALRHPAHVRAMVLVDAAGSPSRTKETGEPLIFKLMASPVARPLIRDIDARPLVEGALKSAYGDPALVTPALVDRYVELSRAPGHRDILLTIQSRPRAPVTAETFGAMKLQTLVMHGASDKLIPLADGEGFARAIPGARLITYPGVGHVPMEQIPDRSAADLAAFLKSLDGPPAERKAGKA
ncbi:MAG: alpha/beta hydrolase [Caulobacteraceae bacterium]|nr:alpha/beta hydrolase [Caulobacteraceae bacterium]